MRIVPSNTLLLRGLKLRTVVLFALLSISIGCARFPDVPPGPGGTLLVIKMTVDGKIRTGQEAGSNGIPYVYMVAFRLSNESNPTSIGPIPVIAPPWGNGFVAGNATNFVWWNPQLQPSYAIFKFADTLLNEYFQTGTAVRFTEVTPGSNSIQFEVNLSQLEPDAAKLELVKSVQINFLTMDRIPVTGTAKFWDALGDGRRPTEVNSPILIPLNQPALYNNQLSGGIEPRGDQPEPDLDIVDWSVEVRRQ